MRGPVLREHSGGGTLWAAPVGRLPREGAETLGDRQNFREVRQNVLNPHGEKARGAYPMSPPPGDDCLIVLEMQAIPIRGVSRYVFGTDYASVFGMGQSSMLD